MKIAICDDDSRTAHQLEMAILHSQRGKFEIEVYNNPVRLANAPALNSYDAFFLDIEMPELNGVQLAQKIRASGNQNPIIFLTSYKQYMEEVFRLQTFDYLIKPIQATGLDSVIERLLHYLNSQETRFVFTFNKETHSLSYSSIYYFEKKRRTVLIHTQQATFETLMTTQTLLDSLTPQFIQIHHSYIINSRHFQQFEKQQVVLANGEKLPLSRKYSKSAKDTILMQLREIIG